MVPLKIYVTLQELQILSVVSPRIRALDLGLRLKERVGNLQIRQKGRRRGRSWQMGGRINGQRWPDSDVLREVELGSVSSETQGGFVVSSSRCFCGVEGAQPDSSGLVGVSNLSRPFAPWPLSHSPVSSSPLFSTMGGRALFYS